MLKAGLLASGQYISQATLKLVFGCLPLPLIVNGVASGLFCFQTQQVESKREKFLAPN